MTTATSFSSSAPRRSNDLPVIAPIGLGVLRFVGGRAPAIGERLANVLAGIAWRASRTTRDGAILNASRLLGSAAGADQVRRTARQIVGNWYRGMFDAVRNGRRDFRDLLPEIDRVVGRENYARARATGRGLIVATAHLGVFEILAAALRQYEPKVHAVMTRDKHAGLESLRSAQYRRLGIVEATVDHGYDVWMSVKAALERDEVVLVHADSAAHGQRGARVRFAGGHIAVPTRPVKLALETGAPIVPMFAVRTSPATCRVFFESPLTIEPGPSEEGGIHPGVYALASVIERYAVQYADQWRSVDPLWIEDRDLERASVPG